IASAQRWEGNWRTAFHRRHDCLLPPVSVGRVAGSRGHCVANGRQLDGDSVHAGLEPVSPGYKPSTFGSALRTRTAESQGTGRFPRGFATTNYCETTATLGFPKPFGREPATHAHDQLRHWFNFPNRNLYYLYSLRIVARDRHLRCRRSSGNQVPALSVAARNR